MLGVEVRQLKNTIFNLTYHSHSIEVYETDVVENRILPERN